MGVQEEAIQKARYIRELQHVEAEQKNNGGGLGIEASNDCLKANRTIPNTDLIEVWSRAITLFC